MRLVGLDYRGHSLDVDAGHSTVAVTVTWRQAGVPGLLLRVGHVTYTLEIGKAVTFGRGKSAVILADTRNSIQRPL